MIGFMSNVHLTSAKETFMLDRKAAGLHARTLRGYRDLLTQFIKFTGDIAVKDLKPDHVRAYIAELSDRVRHSSLAKHYAVIRTWVRWLYAQKLLTERSNINTAPRLRNMFPTRSSLFLTSESKFGNEPPS